MTDSNRGSFGSKIGLILAPEMYAEVIAANGEFPGAYMTTSDGRFCSTVSTP